MAAWLAAMPAGTEIKIAKEKPRAMITSKALILRLEIFLTALFIIPKSYTSSKNVILVFGFWLNLFMLLVIIFFSNYFLASSLKGCHWGSGAFGRKEG